MNATRRKVIMRLLVLGANLATIAVIVKLATVSLVRAAVVAVACVLVVIVLQRHEVASLVHRLTGR